MDALVHHEFSVNQFTVFFIFENIFLVFVNMRSGLVRSSPVRTSLYFPGLILVFVEIMPDEVILDHKKSYLISFENFRFFQFLAKIDHK
jgi:hypothetical protein